MSTRFVQTCTLVVINLNSELDNLSCHRGAVKAPTGTGSGPKLGNATHRRVRSHPRQRPLMRKISAVCHVVRPRGKAFKRLHKI